MKKKYKKNEDITVIYSVGKDFNQEDDTELDDNDNIGFFKKLWIKMSGEKVSEKVSDFESEDNNKDLVDAIAKDRDVNNIKKSIGQDQIFNEISSMNFVDFKRSLLMLEKITIDEELYIALKVNEYEEEYEILKNKIFFLVEKNKSLLEYKDHILIKNVHEVILKDLIEYFKIQPFLYKKNNETKFFNSRAILLFKYGLLLKGSDVELSNLTINELKKISESKGKEYISPFIASKFENSMFLNFKDVKELINMGMDINQLDKEGRNALWYVKEKEDLEFLIEKGIHLNHRNNENENFIFDYIRNMTNFNFIEQEIIDISDRFDINLNTINKNGENILFIAARKNIKILHYLLNLNLIDPKQRNNSGENILFFIDDKRTIQTLIEKLDFDVNIINNNGENLLFKRNFDTIAILIEMGVDGNLINFNGKTYLER